MSRLRFVFGFLFLACSGCVPADEDDWIRLSDLERPLERVHLDAGEAARIALETRRQVSVELADGLELSLWAPDRLLEDPVALDVDHQGRIYAAVSRRAGGFLDIRNHPTWTTEALALRTVEDYRQFVRRELSPERSEENSWLPDLNGDGSRDWRDLTVNRERLYRIEDTNGDGLADVSVLLLEAFDTEVTDLLGGVMVHDGTTYLAVAPDLWRVDDTSGDGYPDVMRSISHGYNVHPGFWGHGMSGVRLGPDGRVYWSVGDMGFTVTDSEGRTWSYPNQGAVLRSEPDGTGFEVFAVGLRNTHEFDFDEFGNLISVDNDGDHPGERERLVYLVEGSDSGWRVNWQFGKYTDERNNRYNVWMDEGLSVPRFEGQPAYVLPPIENYHNGPTGLVYNPGTALGEEWRGRFFMSEFVGAPARSRIHSFRLEEKGAGFDLVDDRVVLSGLLPTGIVFGPDGALYVADWVEGWDTNGEGRIWKLDVPGAASESYRLETQRLLAESFDARSGADLVGLLGHADRRVRMKAQLELVLRSSSDDLLAAARQTAHRLARLHGLWGIGQLLRQDHDRAGLLAAFLEDDDAEVRAQAAKVIGDLRHADAAETLIRMLEDPSPRVRFFAAEALGRIGYAPAMYGLIVMLDENDDEDVYLRHAASLAMARIAEADRIVAQAEHPSRAVRLAAVVALRRMKHPGVTRFLADVDEAVVTEAARAISDDGSIEEAIPELARILDAAPFSNEALIRRAIDANLRVGTAEAARRVAAYAAAAGAPENMRVEAAEVLGIWPRPSAMNRVDGIYHGPLERDVAIAHDALAPVMESLLADGSASVRQAMARAVGRLEIDVAAPALLTRLRQDSSPAVRVASLEALSSIAAVEIEEAVRAALDDGDVGVRMTALTMIPTLELDDATRTELLAAAVDRGTLDEQQSALDALGRLRSPSAIEAIGGFFERLVAGALPPEIHLDVIAAAEASEASSLHTSLEAYRTAKPAGDPLAPYLETLYGGSAERGRRVFFQHAAAQCARCHAVGGSGTDVGPDLAQVGSRLTREELLESMIDPNARVAPGFGTVSGMPPMGVLLTRAELRDLVEYMSTLR